MPGKTIPTSRFIILLTLVVLLSFWNLVFTKQFTTLSQWEIVNQAYTWYTYAARSIQNGIIPLWDPYRFAGSSFIGEMQTGLFYPFKLALYLTPLDANGMLSERAFNQFFVFSHWLAAIWMFALARYLRLGPLSSLVAAICFGLGGFLRVAAWPNIVDAMVWLPLVVLFLLRAFDGERISDRLFNAGVAGAALGMTLLAGSIHIAIMDGIVALSLAAYLGLIRGNKKALLHFLGLVAVTAVVGFLFGAVQLLPALEYAPLSYRWYGASSPIVSVDKIPYPATAHETNFSAKSIFALLLGEVDAGDTAFTTYFGVMPLILVIIGAWKYWSRPLVRYVSGLALLSWIYTWGGFSLLHGVLYLTPYLDAAREADRFIYLTQFAMAILAGFGAQVLFEDRGPNESLKLSPLTSTLKWIVVVFGIALAAASLGFPISTTDFTYLSFFFMAASYVLLLVASRANVTTAAPLVLIFLIAWDFYAFAPFESKMAMGAGNRDFHAQLVHDRELATFLKAEPERLRVHFDAEQSPNLGHAYSVPLTWSMSATMLIDYAHLYWHPKRNQLLNVRYTVRRKDKDNPSMATPVYTDDVWTVYENADALPRAWIVHRVEMDTSMKSPPKRLDDPAFDPKQIAIVDEPLSIPVHDGGSQSAVVDAVQWFSYEPNYLEVETTTESPGLLILSEVFYPGWSCEVDGQPTKIIRADGILRAVPIGSGTHRVVMRYRPSTVLWGALSSVVTAAVLLCCVVSRSYKRRKLRQAAENSLQ